MVSLCFLWPRVCWAEGVKEEVEDEVDSPAEDLQLID
jgi:hypothetical protein